MNRSFRAEVEFDDDGASMAGVNCGSVRRAEIITIEAKSEDDFRRLLKEKFSRERYYSTIRRVGVVEAVSVATSASMTEASETPGILSLSEWLGVTPARARRILEKSVQWGSGDREKGHVWSAKVGQHIIFAGHLALDGRVMAQVMQMFCDRLSIIIPAAGDAPCMVGNGRVMTAGEIRLDLEKWFRPNGISCPGCGADMLDWEPDHVLYSDPPQVRVHCVECGHSGYRLFLTPHTEQSSQV